MERRKENELRWRKNGGGSLRLFGKIIKPGQIFYAKEKDISDAFRDIIECLEPEKLLEKIEKEIVVIEEEVEKVFYKLKKNLKLSKKDKVLYDIVDNKDKVITEEPLTKEDGEKTIKALS